MRGARGYRRNERSPFRALTPLLGVLLHEISKGGRRNERSPFRALTHPLFFLRMPNFEIAVEMKEARLGR